jgi:ATP-dependent DNA ligase
LYKSWSSGVGKDHSSENHIHIEKIFSRTSRPISIKIGANLPWVKRLKIDQKKGQVLFQGEIITEMQKLGGSFKNLLQNHRARRAHIYRKDF